MLAFDAPTLVLDTQKFPTFAQARGSTEGTAHGSVLDPRQLDGCGYFAPISTVRRLRPLARRFLMTLRPAAEDIRLRKPWVRLRRLLCG